MQNPLPVLGNQSLIEVPAGLITPAISGAFSQILGTTQIDNVRGLVRELTLPTEGLELLSALLIRVMGERDSDQISRAVCARAILELDNTFEKLGRPIGEQFVGNIGRGVAAMLSIPISYIGDVAAIDGLELISHFGGRILPFCQHVFNFLAGAPDDVSQRIKYRAREIRDRFQPNPNTSYEAVALDNNDFGESLRSGLIP